MQVFYFDWLFVESALNQDRFPGCVIHVSHIFEGVEPHHLRVTGITVEVPNSVSCVSRKVCAWYYHAQCSPLFEWLRQGKPAARFPLHPFRRRTCSLGLEPRQTSIGCSTPILFLLVVSLNSNSGRGAHFR